MGAKKVLLIENARLNGTSFAAALQRKYQLEIAHSGKQGLSIAQSMQPDIVVLDAASLRTSGNRICFRLRICLGEMPIIHIRPSDAKTEESPADVLLIPPFTSRKLINRIERLVSVDEGEVLQVGPFCLNLERHLITTPWSEKKLTPKLFALFDIFLRNPNQTLERKYLMQKVWQTDYMGDTRTLDVHIRWIRQIVEPTPGKKQYLQTVRGIGYRFDLPAT
ncbi:MAG: response regulator transcription factor [Anaerolineae bacterium]|nr:response regulator transcription factor [Anaerolineae bacterium]